MDLSNHYVSTPVCFIRVAKYKILDIKNRICVDDRQNLASTIHVKLFSLNIG